MSQNFVFKIFIEYFTDISNIFEKIAKCSRMIYKIPDGFLEFFRMFLNVPQLENVCKINVLKGLKIFQNFPEFSRKHPGFC